MTTLQQLVADRMAELDLSYRRAASKSRGMVSHGTLNNIVLGRHAGEFDDETLAGIALALDLPVTQVREAAGASSDQIVEFRLPKKANRLSAADRKAVLAMVDALLQAHRSAE